MDFKFCKKCNQEKPVCDFYKDSTKKSGFTSSCKECRAKYYRENFENIKVQRAKYRRENPKKIKEYYAKYNREKYKNNKNFRLILVLRNRLRTALKSQSVKKSNKTLELIGCSVNELWEHLEGQFTDGMTRQNHGEWHIDHIKPCSAFDLTDPKQQKKCFNYKNLQPLWSQDNFKKSNKWEESQ